MLVSVAASASVVITGTRVIYPSDSREVSVKLSNVGKSPVLIQSWIDTGDIDATPEKIDVPFTITPPINRVDPDKGQTLRIGALPAELPSDQESLFWLNVLEIPAIKQQSVTTENYLKMAFRTRIKMFYRPKGLPESPAQAADSLIWKASGAEVRVENPSPYFVSLVTATANGTTVEADMIAPKSTITLKLRAAPGAKIDASYVNDFGAIVPLSAVLK
ncbi:fimbrial biogenesis chaperone [Enterobacillus tribolii]|nr:fimbria/pilus periplasmic chaperone [Enterobacillus tribolii]